MTGYSTTSRSRTSLRKQDLVDGVDRAVSGAHIGLEQMRPADGRAVAVDAESDPATGPVADGAARDGGVYR
jgi:hypothetical protein